MSKNRETTEIEPRDRLQPALLDRLTHHAHILTTRGISYRTKQHAKED